MTKISKEKKISDEITVLNVMEQQAKENINVIAKKCGFSHQKVARIIKDLEKKKIIWGYSAITDGEERGLKHFVLLTKRSTMPLDAAMQNEVVFEKLDDYLSNNIKIEDILLTHGTYNGIVTFYAPDLMSAKKMVEDLFRRTGKYLQEPFLLETLFPIRKSGLKNPQINKLVEYI